MGFPRLPGVAALLTAGAVVVSGCGTQIASRTAAPPPSGSAASVAPPAAAKSAPSAEPEPAAEAPRKTLRLGAKGSAVKWLQKRLTELGYRPGKADGRYGGTTLAAVWAFQKVNGIKPTSTIARRTWQALETPKAPRVLARNGRPTRAEVDLTKQVMVLYVRGKVKLITHVSSGSNIPYCETTTWQGRKQRFCGSASTPHRRLPDDVAGERVAQVLPRPALQPHLLQRRHRLPRRAVGAPPSRLARLRPHADERRGGAARPARQGHAGARQGQVPRLAPRLGR
ncbi:hypothetical protein GCM10020001_081580 [Nonomuraea salmonea]